MSTMWEEIGQQPAAIEETLREEWPRLQSLRAHFTANRVQLIVLAARGTSDNAAQFGRYLLEITTGIPVSLAAASVITLYGAEINLKNALVVAVSQSGESTDTNIVLERAQAAGSFTIGITNERESALARLAQHTMFVRAGKERSVAATKTYTGQLLCFYLLAYALGAPIQLEDLQKIAGYTHAALSLDAEIHRRAERYRFMQRAVCIGRGLNYANSFESALKLMETCYVVAERFSSADLLHGPIAMMEESFPAFAFCPPGVTAEPMCSLLDRLQSIKAEALAITDASHPNLAGLTAVADDTVVIPEKLAYDGPLPVDVYTPIPYIVPMQLMAAHLAKTKRLDPDHPRTLSKVTKTV
jgi:glucosamine--fructose-6-phosphate aminotransferase (isomerizing)